MEVRRVADVFAEGEVEKASTRVASALHAHRQTLHTLQAFLDDNHQLTKLVQDLPHKVRHSVMVPFGKAAFFPGQLVHTNEFLVLLGEGYYAECSASRTLNILDRRGKFLGFQIAGMNSQIADLDVEARFFTETLAEAAGGYVEIREEYVESLSSASASNVEGSGLQVSESDGASSITRIKDGWAESSEMEPSMEDKEHELLMARLDELEAAEAAANWDMNNPGSGDDIPFQSSEPDYDQSVPRDKPKVDDNIVRVQALRTNEHDQQAGSTDCCQVNEFANRCGGSLKVRPSLQSPGDILKFEEWRMCISREENSNQTADLMTQVPDMPAVEQPEEKCRVAPSLQTGTLKAFTGTVLERSAPNLLMKPSQDQAHTSKRPASKFKMRQMKDR